MQLKYMYTNVHVWADVPRFQVLTLCTGKQIFTCIHKYLYSCHIRVRHKLTISDLQPIHTGQNQLKYSLRLQ